MADPKILGQEEARGYLGLSKRKWYEMRDRGELPPPVKLDRGPARAARGNVKLYWRREDLDRWLAARPADRAPRDAPPRAGQEEEGQP